MRSVATAFARAAASLPPAPAGKPAWVRDDRYSLVTGAMLFTLLVLMIVPEGLDYGDLSSADAPRSGDALSRLLWLALLGGGGLLLLSRAVFTAVYLRWLNPFLIAFALLCVASLAWSVEPAISSRRAVRLFTILIASIAFVVTAWHGQRFQNVFRPSITAVLAGSLLFGLARPDLAIHQDASGVLQNAWHGLANHKNGFGDIACVGLILWMHAWLSGQARPLSALIGGGIAALCLLLSRSSTSMVAGISALLFLLVLLRAPRAVYRYLPAVVIALVGCLLAFSLAILHVVPGLDILLAPVATITGKDLTFTGRTEIWEIIADHIQLHPWLGTGYGAFWTGPIQGAASYEFVTRMYFYPGSAHNGYLDILNDLGIVGLVLLLGYLAFFVTQSLRLLGRDRVQASLYLALFLHQLISNLTESRWFSVLSVDFAIMTLTCGALGRSLLELHLRQHAVPPHPADRRHGLPVPA